MGFTRYSISGPWNLSTAHAEIPYLKGLKPIPALSFLHTSVSCDLIQKTLSIGLNVIGKEAGYLRGFELELLNNGLADAGGPLYATTGLKVRID